MIRALISQVKGLAVFDDGKRVGIIDARALKETSYEGDTKPAQLLSGANDLESVTTVDLEALRRLLATRVAREEALASTLLLLEPSSSETARRLAADALSSPSHRRELPWVQGVLLSAPLPAGADISGALKTPSPDAAFLKALPGRQKQIELVRRTWFTLPDSVFETESRESALARVIRAGVFRTLLLGGPAEREQTPFDPAIELFIAQVNEALGQTHATASGSRRPPVHHSTEEQRPAWLWAIAPWRSGWMASHWPEMECLVASARAPRLLRHEELISGYKTQQRMPLPLMTFKLNKDWHALRHNSEDSILIDLLGAITTLQAAKPSSEHRLIVQAKSFDRFFSPDKEITAYQQSERGVLEGIASFLRHFLGLTHFEDSHKHSLHFPGALIDNLSKVDLPRDDLYWAQTVDKAQQLMGIDSLFHIDQFIRGQNKNERFKLQSQVPSGTLLVPTTDRYMLIFGIFAISRRLERNGGLIYSWQNEMQVGKKAQLSTRTLLLNPERRLDLLFEGYGAWILQQLMERLSRDLSSGVRRDRCGWRDINELDQWISGYREVALRDIRNMKNQIRSKGFSEDVIEQNGGQVRLNPEFVVVSPTHNAARG